MPAACARAQRARHLGDDLGRLAQREAAAVGEALEEVLAVEQLHHDEGLVAVDAVVEDLHDVGAAELGGGGRLAPEALARGLLLGELRVDELDRDVRL